MHTPCLSDNYGYLVYDPVAGLTATIDSPDAAKILAEARQRGWTLTHIFNTHHHADHAGGNPALQTSTRCEVVGPRADAARIPGIDTGVGDGDTVEFGEWRVEAFETPGYTTDHIVYHIPDTKAAFVGDTLFAMGCGRLFEGSPDQMWRSLQKILSWPDDVAVFARTRELNDRF